MNRKKIIYPVAIIACFIAVFAMGAWVGVNKLSYHVSQPGTIDFSLFWDAYNKLEQNFIDPSKITNQKIVYGAINGMANSLGDPYTEFFDPTQAQMFQQDLAGSFEGIGVEVGVKDGLLTVIAPLKGTPGENAGLKSGDNIVKINGKDTTDTTADDAVGLIRGPKGTPVTLTISRENWTSTKDIKIIRDTINVPSIDYSIKDGNIAYIQIYQFDQNLPSDFEAIARKILQSPVKKIVLDLRNNPGGYLDAAQNIAGWFLKSGQTVTIEDFGKGKTQQIYTASGNSDFANYPMVILMNQGSASASEILAGSLRDNRGIELIGTKSFGKGCVQEPIDLPGGSFIKVTIANWLTPKGNSISNIGLTPDVKVDITDTDVQQKKDPQLDKALEIVNNLK